VYPALAVLQELAGDDLELLWVGGEGGMEQELVSRAGFQITTLPAAGLHNVGLRALPGNLWQLFRGYLAARRLLRDWQPDVLLFTGGFVAVPVAIAGTRIPSLAVVPDAKPGRALRLVTRFADQVAVVSPDLRRYFKASKHLEITGYPLRKEFGGWTRAKGVREFGLDANKKTLLVFGGSKGAQSINRALAADLERLLPHIQILHITGPTHIDEAQAAKAALPATLAAYYHPVPYLHETIGAAFAAADLAVARAGASTIGELPAYGLPAILVPLPYETNMVQHENAAFLEGQGGAQVMADQDMAAQLANTVLGLMANEAELQRRSRAMAALAVPDAARRIAALLRDYRQPQKGTNPA
jgi:UDP-N-acetylglucosamine--N-acetylmuramyl-(pentapeptide) pyrophosphoryl-undecaprenol N-acetylglucosamine transferase